MYLDGVLSNTKLTLELTPAGQLSIQGEWGGKKTVKVILDKNLAVAMLDPRVGKITLPSETVSPRVHLVWRNMGLTTAEVYFIPAGNFDLVVVQADELLSALNTLLNPPLLKSLNQ